LQHWNRERRGTAEAEEPDAVSRLYTRNPQAAKPDNASAEQWRHVGSIELLRKRIGEVFSRECIFGIPSVD
jgi:hypothetical protein